MRTRGYSGDREKAIELLATTNLKYKEIEKLTGVPHGTINSLALTHRPPEVRAANRRKAGTENVMARHASLKEAQLGESIKKEAGIVPIQETHPTSKRLSRTMTFSYEAKTEAPITKEEALQEILMLQKMIHSSSSSEFVFSFSAEIKGGEESGTYKYA